MKQAHKICKINFGDRPVANHVKVAECFVDRLIGLMFSDNLGKFDGLLIKHCNSIHTCFMNYPIDVVFMTREGKIVKIKRNMRPWRMTLPYLGACQVLEVMGGTLPYFLKEGDIVCINS